MTERAILLLAHGGPECLDDIPEFLFQIRRRPISQEFLENTTKRYQLIGGKSPLLAITKSLAAKFERETWVRTYVGMRHFHPFIEDTLFEMHEDRIASARVICLAPHFSHMSVGAYRQRVYDANAKLDRPLQIGFIDSWHDCPVFIKASAAAIQNELGTIAIETERTHILFTAHSLPERIALAKDPYVEQLLTTARQIAEHVSLRPQHFHLAFQSASPTGEPWIGPTVESELERLAQQQAQTVVISPIGFVAEHVEILYDIDIALQKLAKELGIQLKRTAMLNDSDAMIDILRYLNGQAWQ